MRQQDAHGVTQEILPPPKKMTLEEFLESDLEGYEYVKGRTYTDASCIMGTRNSQCKDFSTLGFVRA